MSKKLDIIIANPSGNITILVLTPTDRADYKDTARKLLDIKRLNAEQVAYLLPQNGELPEMEMCGLEFCGNASRAFAYYKALTSDSTQENITVKVSGCNKPLNAHIDFDTQNVSMAMPVPTSFREYSAKELSLNRGGILVNIDGISHLILEDVPPMLETFENIKDFIYSNYDASLPAFGVMFCDTTNGLMTPVVYVKDVDTTYFEGSCASGTVAASFALASNLEDGTHDFSFEQPEGILSSSVIKSNGCIESIILKGTISLSEKMTVEI